MRLERNVGSTGSTLGGKLEDIACWERLREKVTNRTVGPGELLREVVKEGWNWVQGGDRLEGWTLVISPRQWRRLEPLLSVLELKPMEDGTICCARLESPMEWDACTHGYTGMGYWRERLEGKGFILNPSIFDLLLFQYTGGHLIPREPPEFGLHYNKFWPMWGGREVHFQTNRTKYLLRVRGFTFLLVAVCCLHRSGMRWTKQALEPYIARHWRGWFHDYLAHSIGAVMADQVDAERSFIGHLVAPLNAAREHLEQSRAETRSAHVGHARRIIEALMEASQAALELPTAVQVGRLAAEMENWDSGRTGTLQEALERATSST